MEEEDAQEKHTIFIHGGDVMDVSEDAAMTQQWTSAEID